MSKGSRPEAERLVVQLDLEVPVRVREVREIMVRREDVVKVADVLEMKGRQVDGQDTVDEV